MKEVAVASEVVIVVSEGLPAVVEDEIDAVGDSGVTFEADVELDELLVRVVLSGEAVDRTLTDFQEVEVSLAEILIEKMLLIEVSVSEEAVVDRELVLDVRSLLAVLLSSTAPSSKPSDDLEGRMLVMVDTASSDEVLLSPMTPLSNPSGSDEIQTLM